MCIFNSTSFTAISKKQEATVWQVVFIYIYIYKNIYIYIYYTYIYKYTYVYTLKSLLIQMGNRQLVGYVWLTLTLTDWMMTGKKEQKESERQPAQ
jgi:hypothetical protein